ncbi:hypothetical protein GGR95_000203 [Sulfitobacter undariae]|uniref:5-carboxymethyl-2-hydroxymuconate isomerase n=1 Tax=Sulfitobacter undariae TaxID=1563671 RepID=A0A7W6H0E3_9RHOB|nr:hypothetical protein [Sulfitobacter undariae]MBB3992584.1 hypothetical protein [Sulfitobacter undariae]
MPQADLSYSAHLDIDAAAILATVEQIISAHDDRAGDCKGRAFPVADTHHTHALLRLRMLRKPHRNEAFMQTLLEALQTALNPMFPAPCIIGVELGFLEPYYGSVTHV